MKLLRNLLSPKGPKWLNPIQRRIPYPLRSAKISLDLNIFGFWLKPDWYFKQNLTESVKSNGTTIWWVRWLWFQVSYSRWL